MPEMENCLECGHVYCPSCGDGTCPACGYDPALAEDVICFEAAPELDQAINEDSDDYAGRYELGDLLPDIDPAA